MRPLLMLAVLILTGCSHSVRQAPQEPISALAIRAHLGFLAADEMQGRMTGTAEYQIAANYVAAQFEALGLQPGMGASYMQSVPYVSSQLDIDSASMRIHGPGKRHTLDWKTQFVLGADKSREAVSVKAPAVFVGYGIRAPGIGHDDYAGIDVRGKIVVSFDGAPASFGANERAHYSSGTEKARSAVAQGAVGMVSLRSSYRVKQSPWQEWVREAGLRPSMDWQAADGTAAGDFPQLRGTALVAESAAPLLFEGSAHRYAEIMALQAADQELPRFALASSIEISRRSQLSLVHSPNVVGVLPGSDPALRDEYVVYTAHLDHVGTGLPIDGDHIYNGAYDNAMGVALMIEAARALAARPPKRSVLFVAVGGEERGLLGSDYFAQNPSVPAAQMVAVINLDMPLFLYPLASVIAFGSEHSSLQAAVADAAASQGLRLSADPLPDEVLFIRSDQYSFVKQGVPSIFLVPGFESSDPAIDGKARFFGFLGGHYHKPSDDLSRPVDWNSALRFARTNVRIGQSLGNAATRPRWNAGNFFGDMYAGPDHPAANAR